MVEMLVERRRKHQPVFINETVLDVMYLVGRGLQEKQIAQVLHFSPMTVKTYKSSVFKLLGVHTSTAALLTLIAREDLDLAELAGDFPLDTFDTLARTERNVLNGLVFDNGRFSTTKGIAEFLHNSPETIKTYLKQISAKVGIEGRERLAVLYRAYQQENQMKSGVIWEYSGA